MRKYTTIFGIDLSDETFNWARMIASSDEIQNEGKLPLTREALRDEFSGLRPALIAIEAGAQSAWISRLLKGYGHEVLVANPHKLRMIYANEAKNDKIDARMLARIARFDPHLLYAVEHRSKRAQCDLALLRARDILVRCRSSLISHVRGVVKSFGERVPDCDAHYFHRHAKEHVPRELKSALAPLLKTIEGHTKAIAGFDKKIALLCEKRYPETKLLKTIQGVGDVTALGFVLTIDNPDRFGKSRDVASYLGLTPRQDQTGDQDPQLGITKAGNGYARRLLVGAAQYILGSRNKQDSELRQWGLELAGSRDKNGKYNKKLKKRSVVAVARKLSVLLHVLWRTGACFEPFPHAEQDDAIPAQVAS